MLTRDLVISLLVRHFWGILPLTPPIDRANNLGELKLGKGELKLTEAPTVTLSLSDEDFGKLVAGKANAQRLFMSGKLKVKGDVMKATKMEPILKRAQTKAKL